MDINSIHEKELFEAIVTKYSEGWSLNAIARAFDTYPTTIRRYLLKYGIKLRHDNFKKNDIQHVDEKKMFDWLRLRSKPVTRQELAEFLGKSKITDAYFKKYPELGQYIKGNVNKQLEPVAKKLYNFLIENNIAYIPSERTTLGVTVTALLLKDYSSIALQINDKPSNMSENRHKQNMELKATRAEKRCITLVFVNEFDLANPKKLKRQLDRIAITNAMALQQK